MYRGITFPASPENEPFRRMLLPFYIFIYSIHDFCRKVKSFFVLRIVFRDFFFGKTEKKRKKREKRRDHSLTEAGEYSEK